VSVILERYAMPEKGILEIQEHIQINISATEAQTSRSLVIGRG